MQAKLLPRTFIRQILMAMKLPSQLSCDAGQAPSHLPPVEDKKTVGRRPKAVSNLKAEDPGDKKFLKRPIKSPRVFFNPLWSSG